MSFELISEEQFERLSEDDEQCFVEFESICRGNMTRMLDQENSEIFFRSVREQYMASVYSVSNECRTLNIPEPNLKYEDNFDAQFAKFSLDVQGEVARIVIACMGCGGVKPFRLSDEICSRRSTFSVARLRSVVDLIARRAEGSLPRRGLMAPRSCIRLDPLRIRTMKQQIRFGSKAPCDGPILTPA